MPIEQALKKILPSILVALSIWLAAPTIKIMTKTEVLGVWGMPIWMEDFKRMTELSMDIKQTLYPTLKNRSNLIYDSEKYNDFRSLYGKPKDWMDRMSADNHTFREIIEKQVAADSKAVTNLVIAIRLISEQRPTRGSFTVTDSLINKTDTLKFSSRYLSPELAVLASNPLESAIAFHNMNHFHGVLPSRYVFNSYGKYSLSRELTMTTEHLLRYNEYWFDFIFVDEFFSGNVGKIRKQVSNFEHIL